MLDTHPTIRQPATFADRVRKARQAQGLMYTPKEQLVMHARTILDAVYTPEEMDTMPANRLITEAEAFEDARGAARTGLTN